MASNRLALLAAAPLALSACTVASASPTSHVSVSFTGGHDTNARDSGRPVVLIAAALGVPTEVFRTAFSGVTPAGAGQAPEAAQVLRNKAALLRVLAPYGVTNARLDEVSNHYRYGGSLGQTWPTRSASAVATVRAGKVVAVTVTDAGAGYSSAPTVTVAGASMPNAVAVLAYGKDFATNGSVMAVRLT